MGKSFYRYPYVNVDGNIPVKSIRILVDGASGNIVGVFKD